MKCVVAIKSAAFVGRQISHVLQHCDGAPAVDDVRDAASLE